MDGKGTGRATAKTALHTEITDAASVGRQVVLSRKPHPMKLCGRLFDPQAFEAHIRETLDIARDKFVELIFRDTCTPDGSMRDRVTEACRIVRRLIGRGG